MEITTGRDDGPGRQTEQLRLDGRRAGRDASRELRGVARVLWEASPDASWGEVAAEARERGLLDREADR